MFWRRWLAESGLRAVSGLATFVVAIVLFLPGLALHEALHLAVLHLLGGGGTLIVRPWRFALVPLTLPSLHVQPAEAIGLARQLAVNFLGPAGAALMLAIPLLRLRDPRLRAALIANVAILAFYAAIEAADLIADSMDCADAAFTTPEFNYGVPLAICLWAALKAGPGWGAGQSFR